jgi:hypothetical protein
VSSSGGSVVEVSSSLRGGGGAGRGGGGVGGLRDTAPSYAIDTSIRQTGRAVPHRGRGSSGGSDASGGESGGGGGVGGGGSDGGGSGGGGRGVGGGGMRDEGVARRRGDGGVPIAASARLRAAPARPPAEDVWLPRAAPVGVMDVAPWARGGAVAAAAVPPPARGEFVRVFGVRLRWGDRWRPSDLAAVFGGAARAYAASVVGLAAPGGGGGGGAASSHEWVDDLQYLSDGVRASGDAATVAAALSEAAGALGWWGAWGAGPRGAQDPTLLACRLACVALEWVAGAACWSGGGGGSTAAAAPPPPAVAAAGAGAGAGVVAVDITGAASAPQVDAAWSAAACTLVRAVMRALCACAADAPQSAAAAAASAGARGGPQPYVSAVWLALCRALRSGRVRSAGGAVLGPFTALREEVDSWGQPPTTPHRLCARGGPADANEIAWELAARVTVLARFNDGGVCTYVACCLRLLVWAVRCVYLCLCLLCVCAFACVCLCVCVCAYACICVFMCVFACVSVSVSGCRVWT